MNIPPPFQQRKPGASGGTDAKSMLPGGAAPIKVGQQPEITPLTPPPVPVPQPTVAKPAPLVSPVAPAAPAPQPQPQQPQMVPAYIAKAMEKQQAKAAKENAMVAAPTPAAPSDAPAPPTDAPARPEAPVQPAGAALSTTPDQQASSEAAAASTTATPPVTPEQTAVAATPTVPPEYAPAPTDTPEQAAQKTTAAATQAELMQQAQQWATAKEDPAFVRLFNQTLLSTALQNQAAIDATKRAIAANPSLAGQPAGEALLGLKAIQLGMSLSDMKATMSVEHAKAVAALNKYGFEAVYRLNQDKMAQDDKDLLAYGNVLDRMISSGASEEELRAYYGRTIKPLLGDKDISFDQFRSPAERQKLLSQVWDDGQAAFRDALDRDDLPAAIGALESSYSAAKQIELGNALIAKSDVATINKWLTDAGYEPITSMADLIGREDDVFIAEQVSKGKAKINESPLQPKIDALLGVLAGRNIDITDPDVIDAVEEYIYQQEFGDPEQPNVLPWDSDVTSYKYKDWEIFDPATGRVIDAGAQFYDEQDNPEPQPGSAAYEWRQALDGAWQKYLSANPDASKRLSRDEWFAGFKKDYADYVKKNPGESLNSFLTGITDGGKAGSDGGWAGPEAPKPPKDPVNAAEIKSTIEGFKDAAALKTWLATATNVDEAVRQGVIKNFATAANLPTSKAEWETLLNPNLGTTAGLIQFGGKTYQVSKTGSSAIRNISGIGDVVMLTDPTTGKRFVMKVNKPGGYGIETIGYMVPVNDDGTYQWIPPGTAENPKGGTVRNISSDGGNGDNWFEGLF